VSALAALNRPEAEVNTACVAAHTLCTSPGNQRLHLARLQAMGGSPDGAFESATLAMAALEPGSAAFNAASLLVSEMELAMYAESAWPQCVASRPDRVQDRQKPDGADMALWRLLRTRTASACHRAWVRHCSRRRWCTKGSSTAKCSCRARRHATPRPTVRLQRVRAASAMSRRVPRRRRSAR
jgi:hypothetical protein